MIRLNANESPWRSPGDTSDRGLNVYPPPRPTVLQVKLGEYYGIEQKQILVTRGSSEAIDVLIRGFCTAGTDKILICPPTFDMYRLYASIQNAGIVRVPLLGGARLRARRRQHPEGARREHEDRLHLLAEQPHGPIDGARGHRTHLPRNRGPRARRDRRGLSRVRESAVTTSTCGIATSMSCFCARCRSSFRWRACAAG